MSSANQMDQILKEIEDMAKGMDPNTKYERVLHASIKAKKFDISKMIISLDLAKNLNFVLDNDKTPLISACDNNAIAVVKMLVDKGADVNMANKGETPIWRASTNGFTEIVKILVDKGADLNVANISENHTPLWKASTNGHTEIVKILVDKGADLNMASKRKNTPLMIAASNGHTEIVKILVDKGANLNLVNEDGETALKRSCRKEIVDILKNASAKSNKPKMICVDANDKEYPILDQNEIVRVTYCMLPGTPKPELESRSIKPGLVNIKLWCDNKWVPKQLDTINMEIQLIKVNDIKAEYHILPIGTKVDSEVTSEEKFIKFPNDMQILVDNKEIALSNIYRK